MSVRDEYEALQRKAAEQRRIQEDQLARQRRESEMAAQRARQEAERERERRAVEDTRRRQEALDRANRVGLTTAMNEVRDLQRASTVYTSANSDGSVTMSVGHVKAQMDSGGNVTVYANDQKVTDGQTLHSRLAKAVSIPKYTPHVRDPNWVEGPVGGYYLDEDKWGKHLESD